MLEQQPWVRYAPDLLTEYDTCQKEGRDVEPLRELVEAADRLPGEKEGLAAEIGKLLNNAPLRADYPYEEPTDLEDIRAARPAPVALPRKAPTGAEWEDKLRGAWIGRIAGCLLGKPVEGIRLPDITFLLKETGNYPMTRYIFAADFTDELCEKSAWPLRQRPFWADTLHGIEPIDDDTNYPVLALRMMQNYGWNFRPADVLEAWMTYVPYFQVCTAERVCYRNAAVGLMPPETATWHNPYREMIGARIRGDFFGWVTPGEPELAAELGWRDATIYKKKNGIYSEMYVCAMIAAAAVCDDIEQVVAAGLAQIPEKCRLAEQIRQVVAWYHDGVPVETVFERAVARINYSLPSDWVEAIANDMVITAALLYGQGDFSRAVGLSVQGAMDTDCNGATVGSIMGVFVGKKGIDPAWIAPFCERLQTSVMDYNEVTVDQLAAETQKIIDQRPR